jgi:hypothetical protein
MSGALTGLWGREALRSASAGISGLRGLAVKPIRPSSRTQTRLIRGRPDRFPPFAYPWSRRGAALASSPTSAANRSRWDAPAKLIRAMITDLLFDQAKAQWERKCTQAARGTIAGGNRAWADEGATYSEYVLDRRLCAAQRVRTNRCLADREGTRRRGNRPGRR